MAGSEASIGVVLPMLNLYRQASDLIEPFKSSVEQHYVWLQEVLVVAKQTMASPNIKLLPKTPSAKRKRRCITAPATDSIEEEDEEEDNEESGNTGKTTRAARKARVKKEKVTPAVDSMEEEEIETTKSGRPKRNTRSAKPSSSTRTTRNSKKDKNATNVRFPEGETSKPATPPPPVMRIAPDKPCPSPQTPNKSSPKPIPGFSKLAHVKEKASAYESFVSQSPRSPVVVIDSTSSEENESPKKRVCRESAGRRTSRRTASQGKMEVDDTDQPGTPTTKSSTAKKETPKENKSASQKTRKSDTPKPDPAKVEDPETKNKTPAPNNVLVGDTPDESKQKGEERAEEPLEAMEESVTKSGGGRLSGSRHSAGLRLSAKGRLSKSKHRSSLLRHQQRNSIKLVASSMKLEVRVASPVAMQASSDDAAGESSSGEADVMVISGTPEPKRSTRSKLRLNKPAPPSLPHPASTDTEDEADADAVIFKTPEPPKRTTRSKLRINKAPPKLTVESPSSDSGLDSQRSTTSKDGDSQSNGEGKKGTRSKMRSRPAQPPPMSSDDEECPSTQTPQRSTRSKMRKYQEKATDSPSMASLKRPKAHSGEESESAPAKKPCNTPTNEGSDNSILSQSSGSAPREFSRSMIVNKHPVPNSQLHTAVKSFIKRNTPQKVTVQDQINKKRKEMEAKGLEIQNRLQQRKEERVNKAEAIKKQREEKMKLAAERRERLEQAKQQVAMSASKGVKPTSVILEQKMREEREKQKLREKRIAEAEHRRKKEEEQRLQKLKEQEEEQRIQEEMLRRKKEFEEAERQRKIAEQRKQEEERRLEQERERQKERERLRREEEVRLREEAKRQRLKSEREKKERAEREKMELKQQQERELQRQRELERERVLELQRIREAEEKRKAEDRREQEEKRRQLQAINKHNMSLQNKSGNTSAVLAPHNTSSNLNSTFTQEKKPNPDSYEMTPQRKVYVEKPNKDRKSYNNYDINNIHSDDSTDDDEAPRKRIPTWAEGSKLKLAIINQQYRPPDLDELFRDCFPVLDLTVLFKQRKARFTKRTSSACWDTPMLKPSGKPFD